MRCGGNGQRCKGVGYLKKKHFLWAGRCDEVLREFSGSSLGEIEQKIAKHKEKES